MDFAGVQALAALAAFEIQNRLPRSVLMGHDALSHLEAILNCLK
jgi:hypothetical protein